MRGLMMNNIQEASKQLMKKAEQIQPLATALSPEEVAKERLLERELEKLAHSTAYPSLDHHIKGWIPGHLYVLTGETNVGKSAASANFAVRVARQMKKVAYFALEPDVSIIEYIAGIWHHKKWDQITDEDLFIKNDYLSIYTKDNLPTLESFLRTVETMPKQDLIIVDHIGYFTNDPNDRRPQTQQESQAIKRIVSVAKKKKSAIIIIAHPRKPIGTNKKNKPLTMNEISGSAAFKQDATDVLIIHMDKDPNDQYGLTNLPTGYILLPKVKTGKPGIIPIYFVPDSPIMLEKNESAGVLADELIEDDFSSQNSQNSQDDELIPF